MEKEGKYIYCIIDTGEAKKFGYIGIGGRGDELYTVCFNNISAVVSSSPLIKYSIAFENTYAHEKAIEEVMKTYTVLPVKFCTIAEDEAKLISILQKQYDDFEYLLNKFEDKKELGLKALFKQDNIYSDILEKYEEIKNLKTEIADKPLQSTYYQRIEIGKMIESALEKERKIHEAEVMDILSPLSVESKNNTTYGEMMFLNAAFLIENSMEPKFDEKVNELADKYGDKVKFRYIGTAPPFNFVNLVIETGIY